MALGVYGGAGDPRGVLGRMGTGVEEEIPTSTLPTPSTRQWWVFVAMAAPVTLEALQEVGIQSGRSRSSRRDQ